MSSGAEQLDEEQWTDEEPALSAAALKLVDAVKRSPAEPLFAVVDGARYGNLPDLLKIQGLTGRSLFLDHADAEIEAASGWLVPLSDEADLKKLLEVSDEGCGSLVLWFCPLGETALHRHLRTINIVRIPSESIPEDEPEKASDAEADTDKPARPAFGNVLFRHYDPDVIASLLPLLDEAQFARMFGPATRIVMYSVRAMAACAPRRARTICRLRREARCRSARSRLRTWNWLWRRRATHAWLPICAMSHPMRHWKWTTIRSRVLWHRATRAAGTRTDDGTGAGVLGLYDAEQQRKDRQGRNGARLHHQRA